MNSLFISGNLDPPPRAGCMFHCRSGPTAYINEKVAYPLAYDAITAASGDMDSTKWMSTAGMNTLLDNTGPSPV